MADPEPAPAPDADAPEEKHPSRDEILERIRDTQLEILRRAAGVESYEALLDVFENRKEAPIPFLEKHRDALLAVIALSDQEKQVESNAAMAQATKAASRWAAVAAVAAALATAAQLALLAWDRLVGPAGR